jgi:hypothetical protein
MAVASAVSAEIPSVESGSQETSNGANGMSDTEGKAARVGTTELEQIEFLIRG